jgi:GAF domain-containing protein
MGRTKAQEALFLPLHAAVFCVQCELISQNNTTRCLACGSQAVLSLSRLLGGSLGTQPTAHLIIDAQLDRLVRELVGSVPDSLAMPSDEHVPISFSALAPRRDHARASASGQIGNLAPAPIEVPSTDHGLEPVIGVIAERARVLTGASGSAIALHKGEDMVCRARSGRTAPDLGVRLVADSGISADCVRTGEIVLCHDAQNHPRVDLATCRHLGVRSILASPLRHFRRTFGIFEVFSAAPYAFDQRAVAIMQSLSSMLVAAISHRSLRAAAAERASA